MSDQRSDDDQLPDDEIARRMAFHVANEADETYVGGKARNRKKPASSPCSFAGLH
jgi:hypothetical protein